MNNKCWWIAYRADNGRLVLSYFSDLGIGIDEWAALKFKDRPYLCLCLQNNFYDALHRAKQIWKEKLPDVPFEE